MQQCCSYLDVDTRMDLRWTSGLMSQVTWVSQGFRNSPCPDQPAGAPDGDSALDSQACYKVLPPNPFLSVAVRSTASHESMGGVQATMHNM